MCSCYFPSTRNECCRCGNGCRYVYGPMGPMGPQGPRGPQGPQGATGPQGASSADSVAAFTATPATAALAPGAFIPLTLDYNSDPADITFAAGGSTVTLQSGVYRISFDANATRPVAGSVSLSLAQDGTTIPKSTSVTSVNIAGGTENLGSNIILNVPATSNVSLINSGNADTTYSGVNMVIQKLNVQ